MRKGTVLAPPSARLGTKKAVTSSRKLISADTVGLWSRTWRSPSRNAHFRCVCSLDIHGQSKKV